MLALEEVRLVVWDLDETFWKGTLSEGGIESFIGRNHRLVAKLAARGNPLLDLFEERSRARRFPRATQLLSLDATRLRPLGALQEQVG